MTTKYYMAFETIVEVTGITEEERFNQAREKFLSLLQSEETVDIICIDMDDLEA